MVHILSVNSLMCKVLDQLARSCRELEPNVASTCDHHHYKHKGLPISDESPTHKPPSGLQRTFATKVTHNFISGTKGQDLILNQ